MTESTQETGEKNEPVSSSAQPTENGQAASDPTVALKQKISELEAQVKDKDQKYVYLYAEFDNFKKRALKERSDLIKFAWEPVARDLLQVVDNLERALSHMPPSTDKGLSDGLKMVLTQFKATLQKQGVQPVEAVEKPFDPNFHEAVGQEPSGQPEGTVVKELQPGYTLHGRLLRPARVTVSTGQSA